MSGEHPLPGLQKAMFLLCPHTVERVFSPQVSCRALILSWDLSLSLSLSHNQLINSQGLHLLILSHWGLGFYHINLGGHKYSVYSKEGILSPEYPGPGTEGEGLRLWAGSPPWPTGFLAQGEEHSGTWAGAGPSKAQHPGWGKGVVPSSPPCFQTLTHWFQSRSRDQRWDCLTET